MSERCLMYPDQLCEQSRCGFAGAVMDCRRMPESARLTDSHCRTCERPWAEHTLHGCPKGTP